MTSDAMVMDVSQDWAMACDVQQRLMQGLDRQIDALDFSGRCRQMLELGGDCYDFMPLPDHRLAVTEWGVEGLRRAAVESAAQTAEDLVHTVFTSMDEYSRGRQTDDATVVVLQVH